MEKNSYISCIKINGVPILPPMMTDSIREEMIRYRYLAIALEEKLKTLHNVKATGRIKYPDTTKVEHGNESKVSAWNSDVDESTVSEGDTDSTPTTFNVETVIHMPMRSVENARTCYLKEDTKGKINAQDATQSYDNNSSYSESTTVSIDVNDHLNASNTSGTKIDTVEATSEIWKPEVPKTLDIIPITLDNPNGAKSDVDISNEDGETSKLIRQGSYVLDAPSPMLLAHMQMEMADVGYIPNSNYVPTPTTASKRKEWDITQAKTKWENETKDKELVVVGSSEISNSPNCCDSVHLSHGQRTRWKSLSQQTPTGQSLGAYQPAKSVDCIQAMLVKEYINRCNDKNDRTPRASSTSKANRSVSIFNLANRFGGSLGSLEVSSSTLHNGIETECSMKGRVQNNCEKNVLRFDEARQVTSNKPHLSFTTERLLNIFKEIEKIHKKQMIDLVVRQQREQSLLQQEFEKQQTRVLMEIRKSFPELSAQELSESFTSSLLLDDKDSTSLSDKQALETVNADASLDDGLGSASDHTRGESGRLQTTSSDTSPCPLDYLYPKESSQLRSQQGRCQSTQTHVELRKKPIANGWTESLDYYNGNSVHSYQRENDESTDSKENRLSHVSRQLFPLDTVKTVHLPVLDRYPAYAEKHVKAVTVINAYAKGYLVRRMMQTERVIALKNTYREAIVCTLKLHADAPLKLPELNFLRRLELQCDAASMNIVELFAQSPAKRMQVIAHDREIKRSRTTERPTSARSYSFATQRTLARKKLKEMGSYQLPGLITHRSSSARSRCQTWTSEIREKPSSSNLLLHQSIKRSTSAGTMRKPWR